MAPTSHVTSWPSRPLLASPMIPSPATMIQNTRQANASAQYRALVPICIQIRLKSDFSALFSTRLQSDWNSLLSSICFASSSERRRPF
ncbi:Uncharacterized protein APZ42_027232 [Daphnia magna]|uniref:Uncharacterized protein n=1 Tax=Daphnia magna TaxID=35525 RepID=A0A164RD29_9CRUS|nr:Uncharacterized protein APZ42_027232 [Daphnia magna]